LNQALLEAVVRQDGMEMVRLIEAGADLNARFERREVRRLMGLRRRPLAGTVADSDSDDLGPDSAWPVGE
jgi:hypothetical protein